MSLAATVAVSVIVVWLLLLLCDGVWLLLLLCDGGVVVVAEGRGNAAVALTVPGEVSFEAGSVSPP